MTKRVTAHRRTSSIIVTTTTAIDSRPVTEYVGVVAGEAALGANVFRNLFAGLRDIVGGRPAGYERSLRQARETALEEIMSLIGVVPRKGTRGEEDRGHGSEDNAFS